MSLLQRLQDVYSVVCRTLIIITDPQGRPVTHPSPKTQMPEHPQLPNGSLSLLSKKYLTINFPMIIDIPDYPNNLFILAPVRIRGKNELFIWAGPMFNQQTKDETKSVLNSITEMADLIGEYLLQENQMMSYHNNFRAFQKICSKLGGMDDLVEIVIGELVHTFDEIDFAGYALKDGEGFVVNRIIGLERQDFIGKKILMGEGLLGQAAISGQELVYWENLDRDFRTHLFLEKGVQVKHLFCHPIHMNHELHGFVFGGSISSSNMNPTVLDNVGVVIKLLEKDVYIKSLQKLSSKQSMFISILMDMSRIIRAVKDLQRLMYILVDMSLGLAGGKFSCVIVKPDPDSRQIYSVSRGLSADQLEDYITDLTNRYLTSSFKSYADQNKIHFTLWGGKVLEYPLEIGRTTIGVLSIACDEMETMQYQSLFDAFAKIGAMAIEGLDKCDNYTEETIHLLHKNISQWNPKAYEQTLIANKLAERMVTGIKLSSEGNKALRHACSLYVYDLDYLSKVLVNHPSTKLLNEYFNLLEDLKSSTIGNSSYSREAQILALILFDINNDQALENLMNYVNLDIRDRFKAVSDRYSTVLVKAIPGASTKKKEIDEVINKKLREYQELTERERQVLQLVMKGHNNSEIASKLFISSHTVKNHLTNVFNKLGVSDRTQAIAKVSGFDGDSTISNPKS